MRLKQFTKLLIVASLLFSCATKQRVKSVEVCLSDPRNDALQCTLNDGSQVTKPWRSALEYTCVPTLQLSEYLRGCQ